MAITNPEAVDFGYLVAFAEGLPPEREGRFALGEHRFCTE
jgi:hypothetical protein